MNNLTFDQIQSALEQDDNIGFCTSCGELHSNIEPDARNYKCSNCGLFQVFGVEQIIIEGLYSTP